MKEYFKHLMCLYKRPLLNGIDGSIENRSASSFELFFDLIFVVVLSKLALIYEMGSAVGFISTILLFVVIYSIWFTLTTYTVMFLKKDINYWVRAMLFLIMLPIMLFLSITSIDTRFTNFIFFGSLATTKIILTFIFKDSIVNAPQNNITASNIYIMISKMQTISAILLIINALIQSLKIQIIILVIVAIIEMIIIPYKTKKIEKSSIFPLVINRELFMERQLLFLILIFGEGLVKIISNIKYENGIISIIYVLIMFTVMFLFYMRISEESEYNRHVINTSTDIKNWLGVCLSVFIFFLTISELPMQIEEHGHIMSGSLIVIIAILIYICIAHMQINFNIIKNGATKNGLLFSKLDIKMLFLMLIIPIILIFKHDTLLEIYVLLLIFFTLHVVALPYREHIMEKVKK